jgi:hypothetical protein
MALKRLLDRRTAGAAFEYDLLKGGKNTPKGMERDLRSQIHNAVCYIPRWESAIGSAAEKPRPAVLRF